MRPPLSPMLLSRIADSAARVRVGFPWWLRIFVWSNVAAITLGKRIYIAPKMLERKGDQLEALVRHELEHVRQVGRHGLIRFFWIYVRDYIRLRRSGLSAHQAYLAIPFEVEATRAEMDPEAL
jgi:hypothetical protein